MANKLGNDPSPDRFEGCGQEGPIRCIFLSEFHATAGPKITCQVPVNYISKEIFDAVSVYIIPKEQLQRSILTVTLLGLKILGFPVRIVNNKYPRNAFYFNLCFVCDSWARTVHYEPVVKKLADYLIAMELESKFLFQPNELSKLTQMLSKVINDLNTYRMCTLTEGSTITHLKVVNVADDPPVVLDHLVPIFLSNHCDFNHEQWDLTTHQVYTYIDGFNHVAKIAAEADVETNLVKACVQNLVYYGVVALIPIFQYSNVYTTTSKLKNLARSQQLQQRCIEYVSKSSRTPACLSEIFRIYASMTYGTTVKDLCLRFNPNLLSINERKLVQFGVLEGLIRRVYKYPILLTTNGGGTGVTTNLINSRPGTGSGSESGNEDNMSTVSQLLQNSFNGINSTDEICCANGISSQQLDDMLERDPNIKIIWK